MLATTSKYPLKLVALAQRPASSISLNGTPLIRLSVAHPTLGEWAVNSARICNFRRERLSQDVRDVTVVMLQMWTPGGEVACTYAITMLAHSTHGPNAMLNCGRPAFVRCWD